MSNQNFIKFADEKGRASSLRIAPPSKPHALEVVGALSHNAIIEPASAAEAQKLLRYAQAALARQMRIEQILDGYIQAALFTTPVENGRGDDLDGYLITADAELHDETASAMRRDCAAFYDRVNNKLSIANAEYHHSYAQAGHDFWLDRCSLGAGAEERDLGDIGQALADAARAFGDYRLWIGNHVEHGDDGMIHGERC